MRKGRSSRKLAAFAAAVANALPTAASARPVTEDRDGRTNILVVMTDDQALADVAKIPNVRRLLAARGTTFADAVDSLPLCCPSRATFIAGQYAHNHGVAGSFYPYGTGAYRGVTSGALRAHDRHRHDGQNGRLSFDGAARY